ncbi:MAG: DUF975 family protein [Eubacteriales bacterium]|nr:DUF975 family protein [Eubacteriales bacterium]
MMLGPYYFKLKAKEALKGNWQTAMVVAFFSGIFMTISQVLISLYTPSIYAYGDVDTYLLAVAGISNTAVIGMATVNVLALLFTPVLSLGCNHYFVARLQGTELGTAGLFSRFHSFGRALWLYVQMGVRIFLWSLLLVVPGIIASIRYSMAPYYLAEHPEMTAGEALKASKNTMKELKTSYFALMVSFIGWMLLSYVAQMLLLSINGVLATMAGLFIQVWIMTYTNGAVASFYITVSNQSGMEQAKRDMAERMRQMGVDPRQWETGEQEEKPDADDTEDETDDSHEESGDDRS